MSDKCLVGCLVIVIMIEISLSLLKLFQCLLTCPLKVLLVLCFKLAVIRET